MSEKEQKYKGNLELNWINKDKSLYYEYDEEGNPGKPIWVDKDNIKVSEPRILKLEKEYGDVSELKDPLKNALIRGDNLLALRTLVEMFKEREEKDKVKCVYIDPPFNTGYAFEHYDDNLQHSEWLTLIRDRLVLIKKLMKNDGLIFLHLDDRELAHCKIIMDEIFGRDNFLNIISMTTNAPSGFKATGKKVFSTSNFILVYQKSNLANLKPIFIQKEYDEAYSKFLVNKDQDYKKWKWENISDVVAKKLGFTDKKETILRFGKEKFETEIANFAIANATNVFRTAAISGGAKLKREKTIELSKIKKDEVMIHPNEDVEGFYIVNGEQILFYEDRLVDFNGYKLPGTVITDVWTDISWTGIAREGNIIFKNSKKPELLIKRVLEMSSKPGDLILDSFLGSGTTASVAHKMNRSWIGIELGKHAETLCLERMKLIINKKNPDKTGISKNEDVNWNGGGGFRYYTLGESLINDNKINWELNYEEISQALFMNFDYKFKEKINEHVYLGKSGHNLALCIVSKEIKIIKKQEIQKILENIKQYNNTKIVIFTNNGIAIKNEDLPENISIKKIPESVLKKYHL